MIDLVKYLINELVQNKDAVIITEENGVIKVSVDKSDMGKIIGRQGKIANSIRTIVKAASAGDEKKYTVEILEAE